MSCRTARKQIGLWVGNDLSQSAIESLEQHIENCPKCQERAEALLSSSDVLLAFNSQTVRSPSDSVWDGVRRQIEEDPRRERRRSGQITAGLFLAAAMLLIAVLPDLLATPPYPVIPVSDSTPKVIIPPDYSPYYPDPTWRELEALDDPASGKPTARNAAYGF
ncbi:MAG: zf-HC2 domain-containing protein [Planctomycetes bacterium]|nr:zf-HC2 domain-containing protein [Planctomycetota bacterium]